MKKGESTPAETPRQTTEKSQLMELINLKRSTPKSFRLSQVGGTHIRGRNKLIPEQEPFRASYPTTAANTAQVSAENSIEDIRVATGLGSFFKE